MKLQFWYATFNFYKIMLYKCLVIKIKIYDESFHAAYMLETATVKKQKDPI